MNVRELIAALSHMDIDPESTVVIVPDSSRQPLADVTTVQPITDLETGEKIVGIGVASRTH